MADGYTLKNLEEVEDAAAKHGFGEYAETRFANAALETERTGFSHNRLKPGVRQPFGHRHDEAEEVYVVLRGSGRVKLDDEILDLRPLDALRVAPGVTRCFEAGPDGMETIAFGPRHDGDGELLHGWWSD